MKEVAPDIFEPETREELEEWARRYPKGFVLNFLSENHVWIHHGDCGHFKGNVGKDLVTNRKLVSTEPRLLERWWAEQGERALVRCKDCKPTPPPLGLILRRNTD